MRFVRFTTRAQHARTQTHACTRTHTSIHAHTHTRAYALSLSHTHEYMCICTCIRWPLFFVSMTLCELTFMNFDIKKQQLYIFMRECPLPIGLYFYIRTQAHSHTTTHAHTRNQHIYIHIYIRIRIHIYIYIHTSTHTHTLPRCLACSLSFPRLHSFSPSLFVFVLLCSFSDICPRSLVFMLLILPWCLCLVCVVK